MGAHMREGERERLKWPTNRIAEALERKERKGEEEEGGRPAPSRPRARRLAHVQRILYSGEKKSVPQDASLLLLPHSEAHRRRRRRRREGERVRRGRRAAFTHRQRGAGLLWWDRENLGKP